MAPHTIVLLGDWYIDENWLISPQELYHSSATGKVHYLARHRDTGEQVTNLCAAAALLETLRSYLSSSVKLEAPLDFVAFGAWNPEDDDLFQRVLCPKNPEEKHLSPYTLSNFSTVGRLCEDCQGNRENCIYSKLLINLAGIEDRRRVSTNRVIRCFEGHGGAMPHQLYRFDWILPFDLPRERYDRITREIESRDVIAVLIVDHGTGVVNERSVSRLIEGTKGKDVRWFVRTKVDAPAWLNLLKNVSLEMSVSDFRLAVHRKGARRWWHGHHLGRAALELLGEMTGSYIYRHGERESQEGPRSKSAVVLLNDNTVFAMATDTGDQYKCVSISQPPGPKQIINLGRTTIFCAALFAQRLRAILTKTAAATPSEQLGRECFAALQCAYRWSKKASEKWSEEQFSLYEDYNNALSSVDDYAGQMERVNPDEYPWKTWDYAELWTHWNDSSAGLGTLKLQPTKPPTSEVREVLQLWRGEGVLKGYICSGGPKRDTINHLVSAIGNFQASKDPTHSFCCLITSPPGWGKSFLAKSLASHSDMEFLEFSIAQMCDNHDLLDCFATIASTQSKTQKRTLIFIDEVNAEIEGHNVMGLLLSPLWGGTFVKDRQTFRLNPSVWVFASTSSANDLRDSDIKGSDFLSRLNGPIIELDSPNFHWTSAITKIRAELHTNVNMEWKDYEARIYGLQEYKNFKKRTDDSLRTEQVYLMVSLLNNRWGPISRVERSVLEMFRDLLPLNGYRSLEFFASCFEGIQRGEVRAANVPGPEHSGELRRHVIIPLEWQRKAVHDSDFVDIELRIR